MPFTNTKEDCRPTESVGGGGRDQFDGGPVRYEMSSTAAEGPVGSWTLVRS